MLVKERFCKFLKKKYCCIIFIISFFTSNSQADIKNQIINNLNKFNSVEFDFTQSTNDKIELGNCILLFTGKIKCLYNNGNKQFILNGEKLAIIQKRYEKIFYYPASKSPLLNILNKDQLIKIIRKGEINNEDEEKIKLVYREKDNRDIVVFFNKKNLNLMGWETIDQFNSKVIFLINIKSINNFYSDEKFEINTSN